MALEVQPLCWQMRIMRKYRGMTQKELAERAGWNRGYYSQWERGEEKNASQEKIDSLLKVLNCKLIITPLG